MTTYTITTPAGGLRSGGTASVDYAWQVLVPRGGLLVGGSAQPSQSWQMQPAGGLKVGGTSVKAAVFAPVPAGGMALGGSAPIMLRSPLHLPSGGVRAGGGAAAFLRVAGSTTTTANPQAQPFPAWAINYETNAPSRYVGLPANSMCAFNGKTYVANEGGIYEFGAPDTDDGAPIDASAALPLSDFDNAYDKRVRTVYLGIRSPGEMTLRITANGEEHRYYALTSNAPHMRGSRATLGRGTNARYWQFGVVNVNGADFDLDVLEFTPAISTRHGV